MSTARQGRSDGGYIGIYTPKSVYLKFFMWLFCLLDPFIPTQIKFLATPLLLDNVHNLFIHGFEVSKLNRNETLHY